MGAAANGRKADNFQSCGVDLDGVTVVDDVEKSPPIVVALPFLIVLTLPTYLIGVAADYPCSGH